MTQAITPILTATPVDVPRDQVWFITVAGSQSTGNLLVWPRDGTPPQLQPVAASSVYEVDGRQVSMVAIDATSYQAGMTASYVVGTSRAAGNLLTQIVGSNGQPFSQDANTNRIFVELTDPGSGTYPGYQSLGVGSATVDITCGGLLRGTAVATGAGAVTLALFFSGIQSGPTITLGTATAAGQTFSLPPIVAGDGDTWTLTGATFGPGLGVTPG